MNTAMALESEKTNNSELTYKAVTEHLSCDLNGEAVILNMKNGKYYGINSVGASIWTVLQNQVGLKEIQTAILSEYDVEESVCKHEISTFIDRMISEELIEVK